MSASALANAHIITAKASIARGSALKRDSRVAKVAKRDVTVRADWSVGSDVNTIVCFNTAAVMGAMRFGFMPSVKKNYGGATSYKTMVDQEDAKSIGSKDPAGFTAVDVLAAGSFATIISAGEILARQVPY